MQTESINHLLAFLEKWDSKNLAQNINGYPKADIDYLKQHSLDDKEKNVHAYVRVISFLVNFPFNQSLPSPMLFAAEKGYDRLVNSLLAFAEAKHENELNRLLNCRDLNGWTPLQLAAKNGHIEIVKALLHFGPPNPEVNTGDQSSLCLAAKNGDIQIVIELLRHDQNSINSIMSAQEQAVKNNQILIFDLLDAHKNRNNNSLLKSAEYLRYNDVVAAIKLYNSIIFYNNAINSYHDELQALYEYVGDIPEQIDIFNHMMSSVKHEARPTSKLAILERSIAKNENGIHSNALSAFIHESASVRKKIQDNIAIFKMVANLQHRVAQVERVTPTNADIALNTHTTKPLLPSQIPILTTEPPVAVSESLIEGGVGNHLTNYSRLSASQMSKKKPTVNPTTNYIGNRHL